MPRHTLSHADQLFHGNAVKAGAFSSKRGVPMNPLVQADLGIPAALGANGVINAQAVAGAGAVALNGALVASGVAALGGTYGRAVSIVSSNVGDTTQTITIRGRDYLGDRVSETIAANGTTTVAGKKAFKYIDSVASSAALAGNLSVGTTDKLGLPYRCAGRFDVLSAYMDTTDEVATVTLAAADTAAPSNTTGDVRGTVIPATATNGARQYRVWYKIFGTDTTEASYGKSQFYA